MGRKVLTDIYMSTLCLELSMLLQAGITIKSGVLMMLDDETDREGKMVLQSLLERLEDDLPLSEAMRGGQYFPPYMVNMIEIGEKAGRLPETLKALAEHYERRENLWVSVKNAALYPAVLLAMMVAVVLILIVQVLPIFNDVFGRMGAQMSPFATELMQFGIWLKGAFAVVAAVVFALLMIGFLMWAIPGWREKIQRSLKSRWGDRGVFGRIASHQFVSSMALALSSGLSVEESVGLAASLNKDSKALGAKYEKCISLLEAGGKLSESLRDSGILSARDSRMLSLGDQSGMADTAMAEIARRSDRSVQDEIAAIVGRIEPTLVIITSVLIGGILLSVMLPLVGIMTSIG